jgi:hypothetical protein
LALLAILIVPAHAVTIDFTGVTGSPGDPSFDGPLASLGVTTSVSGGSVVAQNLAPPPPLSGQAATVNTTGNNALSPAQFRVNFVGGALNNTISLAVWDTNADATRVSVSSFTSGDVLIQTVNLTVEAATLVFTTAGTAGYIIITDTGGDGHVVDNITFEAAVPEPSTFALFGTALVGLGLIRRRRQ